MSIRFLLASLLLTFTIGFPGRAQNTPRPQSPYVGSFVCSGCHKEIWQDFYKNPHFESIASRKETAERTGCEGCHGPGRAHVQSGGRKDLIRAFSAIATQEKMNACLNCHARELSRANIQRSEHTQSAVVCTVCHSIHHSPTPKFLLTRTQSELCYGCHTTVRAQFSMPFKHRVNEGVMDCSDCHNPHGTFAPTWRMGARPRLVDQRLGGEEPCLTCHPEERGPFVFEHAAIRADGCETCHAPHGSTNSKLLRRPVVFTVCLECHNGAKPFGRSNIGVFVQTPSHNMLDPRYQRCTTCHVRIHGSNSDATFLR